MSTIVVSVVIDEKLYSVETKQLVCSLFGEFKSYREIEALTNVPRDTRSQCLS